MIIPLRLIPVYTVYPFLVKEGTGQCLSPLRCCTSSTSEGLARRSLHPLGHDTAKSDVPDQFVHIEDVVDAGRIVAFRAVPDPPCLPSRINLITYLAALNQREGEVPGYVTDLGSV